MARFNVAGILFCLCFFVNCLSYELRYGAVLPAFGTYQDNPQFINPFLFEDESNEKESEDEENSMYSPDEEPLDEFEPIKRSSIRLPNFEEYNVKRDLIKGPSFQQDINEENADSDIANENRETDDSTASKRKDISQPNEMDSDDEDIQGKEPTLPSSTSNMTTTTDDFLNNIQNDLDKIHDQVTKHTLLDTPSLLDSTATNQTPDNYNDNNKKLKVAKDLIGLLYDFKTGNTIKTDDEESKSFVCF